MIYFYIVTRKKLTANITMMAAVSYNKKKVTVMIVGHSLFTPIHIQVNQQREKILFLNTRLHATANQKSFHIMILSVIKILSSSDIICVSLLSESWRYPTG